MKGRRAGFVRAPSLVLTLAVVAMLAALAACSSSKTCSAYAQKSSCLVTLTPADAADSSCTMGGGTFALPLYPGEAQFVFQPQGPGGPGYLCSQGLTGCSLSRTCTDSTGAPAQTTDVTFTSSDTLSGTYVTTEPGGTTCTYDLTGGSCQ